MILICQSARFVYGFPKKNTVVEPHFFLKLKSNPVDWNYQAAIVSHHQDYETISLSTPKLNLYLDTEFL